MKGSRLRVAAAKESSNQMTFILHLNHRETHRCKDEVINDDGWDDEEKRREEQSGEK